MTDAEIQEMKDILNRVCDRIETGRINPTPDYERACFLLGRQPLDHIAVIARRTQHILQEI